MINTSVDVGSARRACSSASRGPHRAVISENVECELHQPGRLVGFVLFLLAAAGSTARAVDGADGRVGRVTMPERARARTTIDTQLTAGFELLTGQRAGHQSQGDGVDFDAFHPHQGGRIQQQLPQNLVVAGMLALPDAKPRSPG